MIKSHQIGITFLPQLPAEELKEFAQLAEKAGFDSIMLWEDCFNAGGFSSAATLLSATQHIQVSIGILPVTVRNPVFTAMEISTLARLYPGRFIAGFGHGVEFWMKQIGAYPRSTLKALEETVTSVRQLLSGQEVSMTGTHVHLDKSKLLWPPPQVPPLYIGGIREKTLQLAGKLADGTILTGMSSPAYVRWAKKQIASAPSERPVNTCSVTIGCQVSENGVTAREKARQWLVSCIGTGEPHLAALGLEKEAPELIQKYGPEKAASQIPEAWLDELTASGTPQQAANAVQRLWDAGADSVVLQPLTADLSSLDEINRMLLPLLKKR